MNKPFLYYTDFVIKNTNENCTGDEIINNIQCIRSWLIASGITMTENAMAAIISASAIVAGLNPNKTGSVWHYYVTGEGAVYVDSYGLWQIYSNNTPYPDVETQLNSLIDTLTTGAGYTAQDDNHTSLTSFLQSYNTSNLSLIFVKNYTMSGWHHNQSFWNDSAWLNSCINNYRQILNFIQNNTPKYSPVAMAVLLKKKKRKWY